MITKNNNQKVNNYDSLYIGDISVLSKPFGGSTSFSALVTGYICSKNFYTEKPIENPIIKPSIKKILCLHGGGDSVSGLLKQTGIQNIINGIITFKIEKVKFLILRKYDFVTRYDWVKNNIKWINLSKCW